MKEVPVAIVDDHKLFRRGLSELVSDFPGYVVICDVGNGAELQKFLAKGTLPEIILLDINMPDMNGYEIAAWLTENYPFVRVIAVSMDNREQSILRMVRAGARGYILKDADPQEVHTALDAVIQKGYHHSELLTATFMSQAHRSGNGVSLNRKESEFLELACSDLTYKEIADRMNLAPRTIDGYRETLFQKLNVKSRVGLAIYAIKNNLISI